MAFPGTNPVVNQLARQLIPYVELDNNCNIISEKKYTLNNVNDYISVFSSMAIQIPNQEYRSKKYQGNGIIQLKL